MNTAERELERMKQVMVYAQLDLAAAVRYALTVHDSFDVTAAVRTIRELSEFTGETIGSDLYHIPESDDPF